MRVLHVISDQNIGGAGVLLESLLQNFDLARVESHVLLPRESALRERFLRLPVTLHATEARMDSVNLAAVRELSRIIRDTEAELVHANAAISARVAGRLCRIPVIHTRHCCFPPEGLMRLSLVRASAGLCNRMLSDRVIATAEAAAEDLRGLGIPNARIRVIRNGSRRVREVTSEELAVLRERLSLTREHIPIGICARLEPCKGHVVFLHAAARVTEHFPNARFLIVGEGSRREELEHLTDALQIREYVRFAGFVEDMAPVWRLLHINVNCSVGTETSCLALSEGMSAGVPMVVSDYGGNPDMLGESEAGLLYPAGDADALAAALARILSDQELWERMSRAALDRYEQNYTAEGMTEHLTAVYEELFRSAKNARRLQSR